MRTLIMSCLCLAAAAYEAPREHLEGDDDKRARLDGIVMPDGGLALDQIMNAEALGAEQLRGKIVVLDFWATWCGPCIASIDHTNELAARYAEDVVIVGVCNPRGGEELAATVRKHGIAYPVGIDRDRKLIDALRVNGFPDYYVLDRSGQLVAADVRNASVETVIAEMLAAE